MSMFTGLSHSVWLAGPPKLVVTPTKLTLLDPFHRSFRQNHKDASQPRHYAKTRAPAISSQSPHRNGHLSVTAAPVWTDAAAQPARNMGVASLLFHRTLSPKDALQVQSYTLEKQQQQQPPAPPPPHTQLQVHSYAREHQPRQLPSRPSAAAAAHALPPTAPQAASCETPSEDKPVLSPVVLNESPPRPLTEQHKHEATAKTSGPVEPQVKVETPVAETTCPSSSSQTPTHTTQLSNTEQDAPRNKRKVCFFFFPTS